MSVRLNHAQNLTTMQAVLPGTNHSMLHTGLMRREAKTWQARLLHHGIIVARDHIMSCYVSGCMYLCTYLALSGTVQVERMQRSLLHTRSHPMAPAAQSQSSSQCAHNVTNQAAVSCDVCYFSFHARKTHIRPPDLTSTQLHRDRVSPSLGLHDKSVIPSYQNGAL